MSPYCDEMVEDFEELVDDLAPSSKYIKEAKQAAHKIFEKFKMDGHRYNLTIGRTFIAGSIAKGTGISYKPNIDDSDDDEDDDSDSDDDEDDDDDSDSDDDEDDDEDGTVKDPDLDLIIFLNDEDPPFTNVYKKFEKLLREIDEVDEIQIKKFSVKCIYSTRTQGDIKVDILAAKNHVKNTCSFSGQDIGDVEAKIVKRNLRGRQLRSIQKTKTIDQQQNKLLSSALAVKTVAEIASRVKDRYVLEVVRLAKYWTACLEFDSRYTPARSCMMEVIAIYSQRKKRATGERCLVSGFKRFLENIRNIRSLDISLNGDHHNQMGAKNYKKPMIRDPVNSEWNNLADGLHPTNIKILECQARKTLQMLERYRRSADYESVEDAIDLIFDHKD